MALQPVDQLNDVGDVSYPKEESDLAGQQATVYLKRRRRERLVPAQTQELTHSN